MVFAARGALPVPDEPVREDQFRPDVSSRSHDEALVRSTRSWSSRFSSRGGPVHLPRSPPRPPRDLPRSPPRPAPLPVRCLPPRPAPPCPSPSPEPLARQVDEPVTDRKSFDIVRGDYTQMIPEACTDMQSDIRDACRRGIVPTYGGNLHRAAVTIPMVPAGRFFALTRMHLVSSFSGRATRRGRSSASCRGRGTSRTSWGRVRLAGPSP